MYVAAVLRAREHLRSQGCHSPCGSSRLAFRELLADGPCGFQGPSFRSSGVLVAISLVEIVLPSRAVQLSLHLVANRFFTKIFTAGVDLKTLQELIAAN